MPLPLVCQLPARTLLAVCLAASLAACDSVPLPAWQSSQAPAATVAQPAPPVVMAAPAPAIAVPVQVTPVPVQVLPVAPVAVQPAAAAMPYSAAVAARFPAPSVVYSTPGLQNGRSSFTTAAEIQTWLREQSGAAFRRPGLTAAVFGFGTSQKGEALEALVLTRDGGTDPAALQANGRPTVLLVGQQHGNEPAGSEALLVIARELAQGLLRPLLERINVIVVPRANPDGAGADQRVTASGVDMNRDHLLLNTPEAQALARLARDYHPAVVVDAHEYTVTGRFLEKFGNVQKFDVLLQYATTPNLPEFLTKAAEEWYRRPAISAIKAQGLSTEWYYTTSTDPADKKVSMGGVQPDTGRNVDGLRNAVSLLVETRGVGIGRLHIQRRVHSHVTAITSVLASTAQRATELSQLQPYMDKEVAALACKGNAVVEAAPTPAQYDLQMLDPVSGVDRSVSVDWDSALALRSIKTRLRPCGYWLSAASGTAVDRLRMNGIQVQRLADPGAVLGDSYREVSRTTGERQDVRGAISDGSSPIIKVQIRLSRGLVDVPRGSYYVALNQPLGNLALAALEPDTQNSFFANNLLPDLQSTMRVMAPPAFRLEDLP